ncbi:MAG: hypothetical protein RR842_10375 [Gordonibacter sp.]|uniref:hypothetical protein n=1 Tax=Gordonibacter sp. TaxID=1968902 RepID=UPI002FCBDC1D
MANFDILESVKTSLGLAGNDYHDAMLRGYIVEAKRFLVDAGVDSSVVESEVAAGVIARGVSDLWNYGAGGASLSPYFFQAAAQLAYRKPGGGA